MQQKAQRSENWDLVIFFKFIYFNLFIFGCAGSSQLHGLSLAAENGGYSSLWCTVFSLWWLLLLQSMCSRHASFSSCGTQAQQMWLTGSRVQAQQLWHMSLVAHGMWDLPGPGLKPVSLALAGSFLTTAPPGKPGIQLYF